jgi:uncharacterized membrane protein
MAFFRLAFAREWAKPMLALITTSVVCVFLVALRILWTQQIRYGFLIWNLFLAWLPLFFALLTWDYYRASGGRNWRFTALAGAWLLFFPNAPYIFTDLIHLTLGFRAHFWVDLVLILTCALTVLILGFVSLFLLQSIVSRMVGALGSWLFIAAVAGLSGFGIYMGRFLRFNSWDVLFRPAKVYHGINSWAADPFAHSTTFAFPALFATFVFLSYLMLYGLTHLRLAEPTARTKPLGLEST